MKAGTVKRTEQDGSARSVADLLWLRSDFKLVRDWMVECGEWSRPEAEEIGRAIAESVTGKDALMLGWWEWWLADMARTVQSHLDACRDRDARMLAEVRAKRGML